MSRYVRQGSPMLWLILAIVLWGVFHSLLASTGIKDLFHRAFGGRFMQFYRLLFNIYAGISFLVILYLMVTLPDKTLYQVPAPYDYILRVGQGASIFFVLVTIVQTDILAFAGLRQVTEADRRGVLIVDGLYRYVRHPLYTFTLLFFWLSPVMTLNSLIVYFCFTIYVLIGIVFEERKLIGEFGQQYIEYRSTTPMLIPGFRFGWNK